MTQTKWDIEQVIANELAFAEHLSTLNEWSSALITVYNDVDIACQCAMDDASKEDRERIRLAMVKLRDEHLALDRRATLTWAMREMNDRHLQLQDLAASVLARLNVTPA